MQHASTTCYAAAVALPVMAEVIAARVATAGYYALPQHVAGSAAAATASAAAGGQQAATAPAAAAAAAAGASSDTSTKLEQKMFCLLVAAVKYSRVCAALTKSAGSVGGARAVLGCYYNSMTLLCASSSAAIAMLGPVAAVAVGASKLSRKQQLLWFHVLGRVLVAASQLLQQVPQWVSPGGFLRLDPAFPAPNQFSEFAGVTSMLGVTLMSMQSMLQQGGAAAAAVDAGSPAAAATPADITQLLQQAAGLLLQLAPIAQAFCANDEGAEGADVLAMQRLHAACQAGGLPEQLYSFGMACCATFPQRGSCGNPACTSLEKFTETALASQGCSGCNKVRMFVV
jgi:hypothetical protein